MWFCYFHFKNGINIFGFGFGFRKLDSNIYYNLYELYTLIDNY